MLYLKHIFDPMICHGQIILKKYCKCGTDIPYEWVKSIILQSFIYYKYTGF